jgi:hypothetical protein
MFNITLICTVHEEAGFSNLPALYHIIETLNPEIIFEEISPSDFDDYYKNKTRNRLETDTIIRYLETHQIEHIPVDYDYMPPESFLNNHQDMYYQIEKRSSDYRKFIDWSSQYKKEYGFKYLNSDYNDDVWEKIRTATEEALQNINNKKYFETYKFWIDFMGTRESEMIKNIYNYCEKHKFNNGVFYIGAGHRKSVITKIKKHLEREEIKVNWNYNNYDDIFGGRTSHNEGVE